MNTKTKAWLILFAAILGTLMVSGYIQSNIISDADVTIPVLSSFGVPIIEAAIVTLGFVVIYVYVLKKKAVPGT